jgi:hypothetical protein
MYDRIRFKPLASCGKLASGEKMEQHGHYKYR